MLKVDIDRLRTLACVQIIIVHRAVFSHHRHPLHPLDWTLRRVQLAFFFLIFLSPQIPRVGIVNYMCSTYSTLRRVD